MMTSKRITDFSLDSGIKPSRLSRNAQIKRSIEKQGRPHVTVTNGLMFVTLAR